MPTPPNETNLTSDDKSQIPITSDNKIWDIFAIIIFFVLILVAISLPGFSPYRERSYNSAAVADLRNAATAQVAYFVDHQTYATSTEILVGTKYGLSISDGVEVTVIVADSDSYVMTSFHERGKKRYTLVGPHGEIQETDLENDENR